MTTTALVEYRELETKEQDVLVLANAINIRSQSGYDGAAQFVLQHIAPIMKQVKATLDPIVAATNAAHKEAVAQRTKHLAPLEDAKRIATTKCDSYKIAQEHIAHEAEQAAQIKARELADEERLKNAVAAEALHEPDVVIDAILDEPLMPISPLPAPATFTPAKHIHRARVPTTEVVSLDELIEAAATTPALRVYLTHNQTTLNQAARSMRERFNIPGCRLVP